MFRNIFGNIPDVTKNLLILNVLFFLATVVLGEQGLNLFGMLSMHYPSSDHFQSYQIITHFFMHANIMHILLNMVGLVVFGSQLERVWGKKRFFIYYSATAFGALILHTLVQGIELYQYCGDFFPTFDSLQNNYEAGLLTIENGRAAADILNTNTLGASGAVYGLIMAFALLFPNTEFRMIFPPITLKAKWLALILGGMAVYQGFMDSGGSIAHFAHLGGMLFGFILIQIWKRDNKNFY